MPAAATPSSSSSPPGGSASMAATASSCSSARSWRTDSGSSRCASGSRSTTRQSSSAAPMAASRRAGESSGAGSDPTSSASSGRVRSPPSSASSSARCNGARRGGCGPPGSGTQHADPPLLHLRRPQLPAGSDRPGASQAVDPGFAAALRRLPPQRGVAQHPVTGFFGERAERSGSSVPFDDGPASLQSRLEAGRQHCRDGGPDRCAVVGGDLLGQLQEVRRQHRSGDDPLDLAQLDRVVRISPSPGSR